MTTPEERLRSIRYGREMLEKVSFDASLPPDIVEEAARIAPAYPAAGAVEHRLRAGHVGLPSKWEQALLDAFKLFSKVSLEQEGTVETQRHLRYTMRHFPDEFEIHALSSSTSATGFYLPSPDQM